MRVCPAREANQSITPAPRQTSHTLSRRFFNLRLSRRGWKIGKSLRLRMGFPLGKNPSRLPDVRAEIERLCLNLSSPEAGSTGAAQGVAGQA